MIKLIASDLDGTLLDDEKNLPSDFFETLDALEEKNIAFAVASGRTFSAAAHLFPERCLKKTAFICDNGACVYIGGEAVRISELERPVYEALIGACEKIGGLRLVVCAESGVYHTESSESFSREVGRFYKEHSRVDSFLDVKGRIYKLAICDERGAAGHGKPALDEIFGGKLNVLVSGTVWMDVMTGGVSKGAALRSLMERLGVTDEETMVFGDYFNDLDMLLSAKWSFCPENGHEDVKRQCRFVCGDCNSGGVTRAIKQFALGGEILV